jgi:hypothetical protein
MICILKKVCAGAQKVDKGLSSTYGMPFDWAEDINQFTLVVPDEPAPLVNIIPSGGTSPIIQIATILVETMPIDENTITAPNVSVDANVAVPPNVTLIMFITLSTHGLHDLSALHLGTTNPWASICHHYHHLYSHRPYPSIHWNQHSSVYPTNTFVNISATPKLPLTTPT